MRERESTHGMGVSFFCFGGRRCAAFFSHFFLVMLPLMSVSADVVINEIMYNPSNVLLDTEYIELYNPGPGTVDLTTYRFDNGVEYEFPSNTLLSADRYLVLCRNTNDFAVAYPGVTNTCGNYSGLLADSGERVTLSKLVADEWVTVDTVEYNDRGAWTNAPDGDGPSLELIHPGYDNDTSESWTASTGTGTPGAQNSGYAADPAPIITDVEHDPPLPFAGASLTIRAYAFGHDASPLTVTLRHRKDSASPPGYSQTVMYDDGLHNDELAGDGIYGVLIPGLAEAEILDFQVTATDTNGPVRTAPGGPGQKFLCCFGDDPLYTGEYLTFHILLTQADRTTLETRDVGSNDLLDGTLVLSSGRIFYNCGVRFRGSSCRVWYDGPKSYRVELPPGRRINGQTDINLNALNPVLQVLGNHVFEDNGVKAPGTRLRRVWINSDLQVQTNEPWLDASQGGIYVQIDKLGDDFLNEEYSDADWGNLYRAGSSNGYMADLAWQGTVQSRYHCYFKETNEEDTDWTDVVALCDRFNNTTGADFPDALWTNINVSQWITYFATHMALNNSETCIATSSGGDYYTYHDPVSNRFDLLPWDLDSIIDLSGSSWANQPMTNTTIWNSTLPSVTNFLRHPRVAPLFVGQVLDMMDTTLSVASMTKHFDDLGNALTPSFRSKLTDSLISRRNYLRNEVNFDLTVLVSGALTGKTTIVTSDLINLSGKGPQPWVFHILVDGARANWSPYDANWSTNSVSVANGMNRIRIEAVDRDDYVLHALDLDVIGRWGETLKSGTINSDKSWSGMIRVTGDVTVASGKKLTILPGTVVLFDAGRSLGTVGGVIDVQGTSSNRVYFMPYDADTQWGRLSASGAGASNLIRHAEIAGGQILATNNAVLLIEDSVARDYSGNVVQVNNADGVMLRRSHFSGVNNVQVYQSPLLAEYCLFEDLTGDGLDCADASGVYTHTIRRCTIRNGHGGSSDGIDFEPVRHALVEDCLIHDMADRCFSITGSTNVTITGCVMFDAVDGFGIKDDSGVTMSNCTVYGCERGLHLQQDAGPGVGHGVARNMIVWGNQSQIIVTNGSTLELTYSDIQMPGVSTYAGAGNINAGPLFQDVATNDFRLDPLSPCRGAGEGGTDMGASYPVGAAPATPGDLLLRNVTAGQVAISWTDNSVVETAFEIERSNAMGWVQIGVVSAEGTNYVDTGPTPGATYSYRVRAVNPRGESFYTGPGSILSSLSENTQRLIADLRITEIMYHPRDGVENGDEYEFLELKNTGTNILDLSGAYFDNGLDFVFEPGTTLTGGEFLVLARNPAAFSNRYPGVAVGGAFTNSVLDNGGERLEIEDAYGERIFDVTYDDNWHETTDGEGYALVLVDPAWDPDQAASWRAGTDLDGSPGADDPAPAYAVVVINEVLAHTDVPLEDAIELYNTSASDSVDIGGWYLSDSGVTLKKYRIPNGTTIAATNYAVFYEVQFNVDTNDPSCFALSEHGDEVYLSSANASSNLTSYRASARFGASDQSRSFGRHMCSDGNVDFVPMSNRTFGVDNPSTLSQFRTGAGKTNTLPLVGPVVINEIMYHPADGDEEFVELHNMGPTNVALYDPARPTNTWRLGAAVDYSFPPGVTLAAGAYLLVTDVAPDLFRQKYQVPGTVPIYGPWQGDLANEGESVKLYHPGVPDPGGYMSYVRTDRVKYNDKWPWPESADGDGPSLERRAVWLYGNDPTNWMATTHGGTPGSSNNLAGLPVVAFDASVSLVSEAVSSADIGLGLSRIPTNMVTVDYAVTGGTASNGVDYVVAAGTMTFLAGQTNRALSATILSDALTESNETAQITLSSPVNALLGGIKTHTLTIVDMNFAFEAYNDLVWASGGPTANITTFSIGQSGALNDYATGVDSAINVSVQGGGGPYEAQGLPPNPGTDAYAVFNGKVGFLGLISYSSTNLTFTFTGMDPLASYQFVFFGNRGRDIYTDRITKTVISDVVDFSNESTAGAVKTGTYVANDSTIICNGYNTENGYVARFSGIKCGGDGDMLISVVDGGSAVPPKFYGSMFKLSTGGGSGPLPAPTIQPTGGTFAGSIAVTLICADPEALVFYTTDGATPTVYSAQYTSPFTLQDTAKVKTRAFLLGYQESEVNSAIFVESFSPAVSFVQTAGSGLESVSPVSMPLVVLNRTNSDTITVGYAVSGGTASNGVDYSLAAGRVTFLPGQTNAMIVMSITSDGTAEPDETVEVSLFNPTNAVLGGNSAHTYTILDDELFISGYVMTTGGTAIAGATVEYSGPASGSVQTQGDGSYVIYVALGGTYQVQAKAVGFLDSNAQQIVLPPSAGGVNFQLETPDMLVDPDSFAVTVREGTNCTDVLHIINGAGTEAAWSIAYSIPSDYSVLDSDDAGGPSYAWIELSGSGTEITGLGDDFSVGPFPIGFSFPFYGTTFTNFRVCANGFISFTSAENAALNLPLSSAGAPPNLIAAVWDDLDLSVSGSAYYELTDTDTLVIEFLDVRYAYDSNPSRTATFEFILKSDGTITLQVDSAYYAQGCTMGIQNATRDKGVQIAYNQAYLHDSMAVEIAPYSWLTVTPDQGTNPPGCILPVTLGFDASILAPGLYTTTLHVATIQVPVALTVLESDATWFVAYNDMAWFAGQTASNITTFTSTNVTPGRQNSGVLKEYRDGHDTTVTLMIEGGGSVQENQGLHPPTRTDAHNVFDGRVNGNGTLSYGTTVDLTLAFGGLDPDLRYELVAYPDRNEPAYRGVSNRTHRGTLEGADGFQNASTPGTTITIETVPNDTTEYNAGYNTPYGYVTRFTEIDPGSDGQIVLRVRRDVGQALFCYLNAFMLRAAYEETFPVAKISKGGAWRYKKGLAEASDPASAWRARTFNDSGWLSGSAPIGHGVAGLGTSLDAQGNYTCFFARQTFALDAPARVSTLTLRIDYDDGFIAWVNAEEVARVNVPGQPGTFNAFDGVATYQIVGQSKRALTLTGAELPMLVAGTNVVAIQVFNCEISNPDSLLDAELTVVEDSALPQGKDADRDGMLDDWENLRIGVTGEVAEGDLDGDGVSNLGEFVSGTNPDDSNSLFEVDVEAAGTTVRVLFDALDADSDTGCDAFTRYYSLQARPDLGANGYWADVDGYSRVEGQGAPAIWPVPTNGPVNSYRVRAWLE